MSDKPKSPNEILGKYYKKYNAEKHVKDLPRKWQDIPEAVDPNDIGTAAATRIYHHTTHGSEMGIESAKVRKETAEQNKEKIIEMANQFINSGMPKRNLVGAIAKQTGWSKNLVRNHLHEARIISSRKESAVN